MHTFLVAAGIGRDLGPTLDRARRTTEALMPRLGASVTSHRASFPTIDGGWFYFLPAPTSPRPLVTEHRDQRQAVLVYGNVDDCAGLASPAEQVASTWQAHGLEAVRRLNGSFSAVLIDLTSASLFVVSDGTGRRALRYFCRQGPAPDLQPRPPDYCHRPVRVELRPGIRGVDCLLRLVDTRGQPRTEPPGLRLSFVCETSCRAHRTCTSTGPLVTGTSRARRYPGPESAHGGNGGDAAASCAPAVRGPKGHPDRPDRRSGQPGNLRPSGVHPGARSHCRSYFWLSRRIRRERGPTNRQRVRRAAQVERTRGAVVRRVPDQLRRPGFLQKRRRVQQAGDVAGDSL